MVCMFGMQVLYGSGIGWCDLERYRMIWIIAGNEMRDGGWWIGNLNF